ncbi:MAG TPA: DUF1398 family protein [Ohtaekwangia sp.]|nr:DUF1398 family protein [Ohtaekwangia sp.]
MFTIEQIRHAHAKVKSGADFPGYIRELKALGVKSYTSYVTDGKTSYFGTDHFTLNGQPKYPVVEIAPFAANEELQRALKIHQTGGTDYLTFCKQAASFGVEKWIVDLEKMTCVYYDRSGNAMLNEEIPV